MPNTEEQELNALADMLESAWVSPYITHNKDRWLDVAKVVESHIQAKQLEMLKELRDATRKAYHHKPMISTESVNSEMAVHTNSLIEYMIAKLEKPKYQLPGFENTMSDLDKLTVASASKDEKETHL